MSERKQGRRSAQDAEKTKCEILRVASELFCELGYERVSLRNISEKAGVSHSLIRHHFGSKEKIWHSISDNLHEFIEQYMRVIYQNIAPERPANVKLYIFSTRLLAYMLIFKQPIQLIADAVRQEDALFDYFIDSAGEVESFVNSLADEYNRDFPQTPVRVWELKWQMILYAHGAASLTPFLKETWSDETADMDKCLLKHWFLYEETIAFRLNVDNQDRLAPSSVEELLYDFPCCAE